MAQSVWFWLLTTKAMIGFAALVWFFVQLVRGRISLKSLRDREWPIS